MKVSIYPTGNGYYSENFDAHSRAEVSVEEYAGGNFVNYSMICVIEGKTVESKKSFLCADCKTLEETKIQALRILERNIQGMVESSDLEFVIK